MFITSFTFLISIPCTYIQADNDKHKKVNNNQMSYSYLNSWVSDSSTLILLLSTDNHSFDKGSGFSTSGSSHEAPCQVCMLNLPCVLGNILTWLSKAHSITCYSRQNAEV